MTRNAENDLLTGCNSIANYLGWTVRQVKHRHEFGALPTFRIGRTVCARRSTLIEHFAYREGAAAEQPQEPSYPQSDRAAQLIEGITAIAARIGLRMADARRLHEARALPTWCVADAWLQQLRRWTTGFP